MFAQHYLYIAKRTAELDFSFWPSSTAAPSSMLKHRQSHYSIHLMVSWSQKYARIIGMSSSVVCMKSFPFSPASVADYLALLLPFFLGTGDHSLRFNLG